MLDFKAELNKFKPLPENKDVPRAVDINSIEDIMDVLREMKKTM
ncbi:MAG: hypothetical protein Q4F63_01450 [Clostridia bacterium]|nr:hypothetical protein [Clostridia bacterium]